MTLLLKKYSMFLNILTKIIEYLCVVLMATGVIVVLMQITGRWSGKSPAWADEYARYAMVWIGMIAAAVLSRTNSHLGVDVFLMIMPERMKKFAEYLKTMMMAVTGFVLLYYGIYATVHNFDQISPGLNMPFAYVYLALPVSGGLILLYCLENLAKKAVGVDSPKKAEGGDVI